MELSYTAKDGNLSPTTPIKFIIFTLTAPLSFCTVRAIPNSSPSSIFFLDETRTTLVPLSSSYILRNSINTSLTIVTLFLFINIFNSLTKSLFIFPFFANSFTNCPLFFSPTSGLAKTACACSLWSSFNNLSTSFWTVSRELLHWDMSTSAAA